MKRYKIEELKENEIYKCLLTGRMVQVFNINESGFVSASSLNEVTGLIDFHSVIDFQLVDILSKENRL